MDVKKLITSRRGIAIELAIGAMFLTVALSIILFSVATHQTNLMRSARDDLATKVELIEVGEQVLAYYFSGDAEPVDPPILADGYSATKQDNTITVTKGEEVVFTIEIDGNSAKISSWK